MPTKRAILTELIADELRASIDFYELAVADRRVKPQLVDALARSRKAQLDEILQDLSRKRLKELCRTFDFDDSGRKKEDLVARLIRPAAASKNNTGAAPAPTRSVADMPEPRTETLSVAQLEQYLWSAADILRGSIDSSDYKTYIFGLLFLKRLSDRFEEAAEKLIAEGVSETVSWTDPGRASVLRAGSGAVGRHPEAGHEHRGDAEQGVRSAGGAEQRSGRRPGRHRLQRRAEAR